MSILLTARYLLLDPTRSLAELLLSMLIRMTLAKVDMSLARAPEMLADVLPVVSLGSKAKAVNLRGKHHRRSKRAPQEVAVPFPLYWQHNLSTPNKRLIHDQEALFMPFCI